MVSSIWLLNMCDLSNPSRCSDAGSLEERAETAENTKSCTVYLAFLPFLLIERWIEPRCWLFTEAIVESLPCECELCLIHIVDL